MRKGYILIADILGFGSIISNLNGKKLEDRINEWIRLVNDLCSKHQIDDFQLLSDTLFISIQGEEIQGLKKTIHFSKDLLSFGLNKQIPIKGAISFGEHYCEHYWGNLTYGKPIINAHQLEISQNWIGITIDEKVQIDSSLWNTDELICYTVPMKKGQIKLRPAVVWDDMNFDELTKNTTSRGLTKKGELLSYSWAEKIRNTYEFFLYLNLLRNSGKSGEKFHGSLPIQVIGMNLSC